MPIANYSSNVVPRLRIPPVWPKRFIDVNDKSDQDRFAHQAGASRGVDFLGEGHNVVDYWNFVLPIILVIWRTGRHMFFPWIARSRITACIYFSTREQSVSCLSSIKLPYPNTFKAL